eukprot:UN20320
MPFEKVMTMICKYEAYRRKASKNCTKVFIRYIASLSDSNFLPFEACRLKINFTCPTPVQYWVL